MKVRWMKRENSAKQVANSKQEQLILVSLKNQEELYEAG